MFTVIDEYVDIISSPVSIVKGASGGAVLPLSIRYTADSVVSVHVMVGNQNATTGFVHKRTLVRVRLVPVAVYATDTLGLSAILGLVIRSKYWGQLIIDACLIDA